MDTQPAESIDSGRYHIATIAFLGWMFAGLQLAIVSIVMRDAVKDLLIGFDVSEQIYGMWFGRLTAGFMLGAATGGYLLGWVGDRWGRRRAVIISVAGYSLCGGLTYFVQSPEQLLLLRFLTGIGVGGMWPNGIALVSEAWPSISRPLLAGIIGTAANIGLMMFSTLACFVFITHEHWRWTMAISFLPVVLAIYAYFRLPESSSWIRAMSESSLPKESLGNPNSGSPLIQIFMPPVLQVTLLAIILGSVPQFGGWGSSNWANAWASAVGEKPQQVDPGLKARTLLARSAPSAIASLVGGVIATWLGRKLSYSLVSLGCLFCSLCMFRFSHPNSSDFLWWTAALGLFNGVFFGWLPLCLPELFPTRLRATGAGVGFNFGRVTTALGILVISEMVTRSFGGDYSSIGQFTSWIYLVGAVVIWFAPNTDPHN